MVGDWINDLIWTDWTKSCVLVQSVLVNCTQQRPYLHFTIIIFFVNLFYGLFMLLMWWRRKVDRVGRGKRATCWTWTQTTHSRANLCPLIFTSVKKYSPNFSSLTQSRCCSYTSSIFFYVSVTWMLFRDSCTPCCLQCNYKKRQQKKTCLSVNALWFFPFSGDNESVLVFSPRFSLLFLFFFRENKSKWSISLWFFGILQLHKKQRENTEIGFTYFINYLINLTLFLS